MKTNSEGFSGTIDYPGFPPTNTVEKFSDSYLNMLEDEDNPEDLDESLGTDAGEEDSGEKTPIEKTQDKNGDAAAESQEGNYGNRSYASPNLDEDE